MDDPRRRDRRHLVTIGLFAVASALVLGFSVYALSHPHPITTLRERQGLVGGAVAGALFLGFAAVELVRRVRHGPQLPGRHTRDRDG